MLCGPLPQGTTNDFKLEPPRTGALDAKSSTATPNDEDGATQFNIEPKKGIRFLVDRGVLKEEPLDVARFLIEGKGLGKRPIGEYQLIQDKLARMEVARMNLQNLVFRTIELSAHGKTMTFAEASAMKLYAARAAVEVAMEAVQVYGGNGYMSEYVVEQFARDAKVLQIYAGTDEIQIRAIAKDLLKG